MTSEEHEVLAYIDREFKRLEPQLKRDARDLERIRRQNAEQEQQRG